MTSQIVLYGLIVKTGTGFKNCKNSLKKNFDHYMLCGYFCLSWFIGGVVYNKKDFFKTKNS